MGGRGEGILNLFIWAARGVGEAAVALLMGEANPSGKLAETYPLTYSDVPYGEMYGKQAHQALYAEGLYVGTAIMIQPIGKRYFPLDTGFHTSFSYRDLTLSLRTAARYASFYVKILGNRTVRKLPNCMWRLMWWCVPAVEGA